MPSVDEPGPLGPVPLPTTQYSNLEAIKTALQAHAAENGYAIKVDSSTPKRASIICSKGGKYDNKGKSNTVHKTKRCRNTGTTKTDCQFRVSATQNPKDPNDDSPKSWTIRIVNEQHNYEAVEALSALPAHRLAALTDEERCEVAAMNQLGHSPTAILQALRLLNPTSHLISRDIYNLLYSMRLEELAKDTLVKWLLKVYNNSYTSFVIY
jgi:hypothetical protein